jgi:rSAM/selenodomain-associated transferase 1
LGSKSAGGEGAVYSRPLQQIKLITAMKELRIVVFAREPVPGQTKTRLIGALGAQTAAALADAFIRDALAKAGRLSPRELIIAGSDGQNALRSSYFRALAREFGARVIDQGPGNLGMRMQRSLKPLTKTGGAILFGTDTPSLPLRLLARSVELLEDGRVVVSPALDGGYYLLGIWGNVPDAFTGIPWGSSRVLALTLKRLRRIGVPYSLGPWWYDVDRPEDLALLSRHLDSRRRFGGCTAMPLGSPHPCPRTAALLRQLGI